MKVLQFPLAKITIWFTAGILFAFYAKPNDIPVFICAAFCALAVAITFYLSKKQLIQRIPFGLSVYLLTFLIGAATWIVYSGDHAPSNFIHHVRENEKQVLEVVLRERPKSTAYRNRYVALVEQLDGRASAGKILINLAHADFPKNLPIGTRLKINAVIVRHRPPKNPDQFDYGQYLKNKSILAQIYADASDVKIGLPQKDIFFYSDQIRNVILGNLEKSHLNKRELAVVAALILGQQQDISADIIQDYQFAGAVHILSVSGLHVGFILMFLTFLLHYLPKSKTTSYLKLAVVLISLWGFAVLAGLSPSVVRSVTMFSFVAVGLHLKRKTNVFHTLLVSMLLILIFEPSFLFDVGFQLSYLALFFILWLQPIFSDWWRPDNRIIRYFWEILTVSFAAQIGTLPLSIYYFHQFPGLFFVTNLIVIPMLAIVMALGILAMLVALLGTVPMLIVKPLEASVLMLNEMIACVASFEQFIFQDIACNRPIMLSLYFVIITFFLWIQKPKFAAIVWALCAIVTLQICVIGTQWQIQTQSEWMVLNTYKSTLIVQRDGQTITIFGSAKATNKMLQTYATANFANLSKPKPIGNLAYFKENKILIVDSLALYPKSIQPDVLLLRQSPRLNLERLLLETQPKIVVADASNYKSYLVLWKATCAKYKIPFHATGEMGHFKL